ncbi:MAG: SCO family protein [Desulfobacterales bacterium]|nr:SCO family protein [Desulfobacterales bacterium]
MATPMAGHGESQSQVEHSNGEHSKMDHSNMDHGGMDHGKMSPASPGHGASLPKGEPDGAGASHTKNHDSDHVNHGGGNHGSGDHDGHTDPAHGGESHPATPVMGHEKASHSNMESSGEPMDHSNHTEMILSAQKEDPDLARRVKVEEKLGEMADLSARFMDEKGNPVVLENIFDKPTVVLPIFFMCTSICNFLQAELANALNQVTQLPGEDFNIISLSFSDDEDPALANASKRNYVNLLKRTIPLDKWYYLTGDMENIRKFTDSVGYHFVKQKSHFYIHPSALVVLAKDGKVIRYLYGPNFLPFDLGMAVSEAEKGTPGISIKRGVLSFCFDYDPENKTYVFKMFRVTGTAILVLLAGFVFFLLRPFSRKGTKEDQGDDT